MYHKINISASNQKTRNVSKPKNSVPVVLGDLLIQYSEDKTNFREYMEDISFVNEISLQKMIPPHNIIHIFGICDGHSGDQISRFLVRNMEKIITDGLNDLTNPNQLLDNILMTKILCNCFAILETKLEIDPTTKNSEAGSTCAMVLYINSLNAFYAVNCGDSSVFGIHSKGLKNNHLEVEAEKKLSLNAVKISRISKLHKPNLPEELERIQAAKGFVVDIAGIPRLCGNLAVSRGFGDLEFRKYGMTELPDVYGPLLFDSKYSFIGFLIVSDGITDYISDKNIQVLLANNFDRRSEFARILRENTNSYDNASVISCFHKKIS